MNVDESLLFHFCFSRIENLKRRSYGDGKILLPLDSKDVFLLDIVSTYSKNPIEFIFKDLYLESISGLTEKYVGFRKRKKERTIENQIITVPFEIYDAFNKNFPKYDLEQVAYACFNYYEENLGYLLTAPRIKDMRKHAMENHKQDLIYSLNEFERLKKERIRDRVEFRMIDESTIWPLARKDA